MQLINKNSKASYLLDSFRFLASFAVVLFHGGLEFIPGYEAVMIFFVLSGYFIGASVIKTISENKWSWKKYLIDRLTRLWIVLIPSMLLSLLWLELSIGLFGDIKNLSNYTDWKVFLGNMFFLQGGNVPMYGMNGPLWSLAYEFWYYILFPCLMLMFTVKRKIHKIFYGIIIITISILLISIIGIDVLFYFPVWLLGVSLVFVKPLIFNKEYQKTITVIVSSFIFIIIFNIMYIVTGTNHPQDGIMQFVIDFSVAISFSLFLYTLLSVYNVMPITNSMFSYWCKYLAGFSYTLYLVHYPVLQFIKGYTSSDYPQLPFLFMGMITVCIVLFYAWFISRVTENNTSKVRNYLLNNAPEIKLKRTL